MNDKPERKWGVPLNMAWNEELLPLPHFPSTFKTEWLMNGDNGRIASLLTHSSSTFRADMND